MTRCDVTVLGAGIFGLSIAWACVARGARVRVIDPHGPGAGASGGVLGALAPHVPENWNDKKAFQLNSLLRAEIFWPEVEAIGGLGSGYGRLGRLQPLADDAAVSLARAREATADALWQGKATWRVIDAAEAGPWAPPSPTGLLVHDTLTARVHPRRACLALAAALRARGVEIVTDAPPEGAVVHATGAAGLAELSRELGRSVGAPIKGQAAVLEYNAGTAPQLFAEALHIVPHDDGTVAIGSTSERDFDAPDTTDSQLEALIDKGRTLCPALRNAPVRERWAGLRPRARSRAPMLGPHPFRPGAFIANGGFKIGFGMAPAIAEVMADLILTGTDAIPDSFRVEASL
ncbi:MAG: FAD-dependent oxidoreductase [Pseudooceanicola sp.]|jgi:glycine/D-amino acid oxidase-like deaminating enzyme|nr:FAD-dependent oxidoreductase [Pseudooceanicola sp.]